jgi:hypothetical protein
MSVVLFPALALTLLRREGQEMGERAPMVGGYVAGGGPMH